MTAEPAGQLAQAIVATGRLVAPQPAAADAPTIDRLAACLGRTVGTEAGPGGQS